jgi:transposase
MEQWLSIRRQVLVEGVSKRQVLRETGMHWRTLEKMLSHSTPPGYRQSQRRLKPKLGPFLGRIGQILAEDAVVPRKQRHTAKRIFERLREEGYSGGYTQVKSAVRELRRHQAEVFVPLVHRPGEAQVDFGHALVKVHGTLRKVVFFVMVLPHSDVMFVQVFERICMEVFWEAHRRAFAWLGGVPWRITYDNERALVAKVLGAHERKLTQGFQELLSHYLFEPHFCRVRRANEKGVVEGMVAAELPGARAAGGGSGQAERAVAHALCGRPEASVAGQESHEGGPACRGSRCLPADARNGLRRLQEEGDVRQLPVPGAVRQQ